MARDLIRKGIIVIKTVLMFFLSLTMTCYGATIQNNDVIVSIRPLHSLVSAVMEGVTTPTLLLKDQQSPHYINLKPSQIKSLHDAKIIFIIDPTFERFLVKPISQMPKTTRIISMANAPKILRLPYRASLTWGQEEHHHHIGFDGHIWLDPDNAIIMVTYIANTLGDYDPEHRALFQKNAQKFINKIHQLNAKITNQLGPVLNEPFLVFHDGYQYFEHHFKLNCQGSLVFEPNDPLNAKHLLNIQSDIKTKDIQCVFQETPENHRIKKLIRDTFKVRSTSLDPLGITQEIGPELYLNLMDTMSEKIYSCLSS